MKIITGKADIDVLFVKLANVFRTEPFEIFISNIHSLILKRKIKFPVLEYLSQLLAELIPIEKHLKFLDKVITLDEIGSYVIAGKMLQFRLPGHFMESISKACDYFTQGDKWYACDIISERVMGYSLLTYPEKTIPMLRKLAHDENKWIVRSVGVAAHYAVKKGLSKNYCDEMFLLLLSYSNITDFHTKKGIGWGAKTIAKFYPDIINKYYDKIYSDAEVKQWFKTKIKIGLTYAKRNSG